MRRTRLALALSVAFLPLTHPTVATAQTLSIAIAPSDQTLSCFNSFDEIVDLLCGQTFTMPATGNGRLLSFGFQVSTLHTLTFEIFSAPIGIYSTATDAFTGSPIATQVIGPTGGGFQPFVFAPAGGLALAPGESYAALLRLNRGEAFVIPANLTDPYAGGSALSCRPGIPCRREINLDIAFKATFGLVPEPGSSVLVVTGVVAIAAGTYRRKRRTP